MCNLYSITTNQAAIIALFRVMNRYVGNLPPMPGVFPDYPAPVVRNAGPGRSGVRRRQVMIARCARVKTSSVTVQSRSRNSACSRCGLPLAGLHPLQ
jgi:hypothetical protein